MAISLELNAWQLAFIEIAVKRLPFNGNQKPKDDLLKYLQSKTTLRI